MTSDFFVAVSGVGTGGGGGLFIFHSSQSSLWKMKWSRTCNLQKQPRLLIQRLLKERGDGGGGGGDKGSLARQSRSF